MFSHLSSASLWNWGSVDPSAFGGRQKENFFLHNRWSNCLRLLKWRPMSIARPSAPKTLTRDERRETLLSSTAHQLTLWFASIASLVGTLLFLCVEHLWHFAVPWSNDKPSQTRRWWLSSGCAAPSQASLTLPHSSTPLLSSCHISIGRTTPHRAHNYEHTSCLTSFSFFLEYK